MAEDAKAEDLVEQLRETFAATIRTTLAGYPAHQALQLADQLCGIQLALLSGMRVTYKAQTKVNAVQVAEDWRRGMSIGEITAKHRISRAAAYKHHPNGATRRARSG